MNRKIRFIFQFLLVSGKILRLCIKSIFGTALRLKLPNTVWATNRILLIRRLVAGQIDRHLSDTGTFLIIFRVKAEIIKGRAVFLLFSRKCARRRYTVQRIFPDIGRDRLIRIENDGGLCLDRVSGSDTGFRFHHETDVALSIMFLFVIDRQETFVRLQGWQIRCRIDTAEQPKYFSFRHVNTRYNIHINT